MDGTKSVLAIVWMLILTVFVTIHSNAHAALHCSAGFVLTPDGKNCVRPQQALQCAPGMVKTPDGRSCVRPQQALQCGQGMVPTPDGRSCTRPQQALQCGPNLNPSPDGRTCVPSAQSMVGACPKGTIQDPRFTTAPGNKYNRCISQAEYERQANQGIDPYGRDQTFFGQNPNNPLQKIDQLTGPGVQKLQRLLQGR